MSRPEERLAALGLHGLAGQVDDVLERLTKRRTSPLRMLEQMLDIEEQERAARGLARRTARSKIGTLASMDDFDWQWPQQISRRHVEEALELRFLEKKRNVILMGAHGLGKTMIAKNIVHRALLAGYSAVFITASDLLLDLSGQESARGLDRRLKHYARIAFLCIDELGYLSYDQEGADLFFQLINRRYEKKSTLITTNKRFGEWGSIFPGAACATALVDRLVHHADVIGVQGKSYRLREAKLDGATSKT